MRAAFRTLLTTASGVTNLVPAARINFGRHPQGAALPGIVLNVVSAGAYDWSLDGPGLFDARVQVDIYAKAVAQADQVQAAVVARLDGYRGGMFQKISLLVASDRAEEVATENPLHRVMMDFRAIYSTAPLTPPATVPAAFADGDWSLTF
jgi:hypothetical protein